MRESREPRRPRDSKELLDKEFPSIKPVIPAGSKEKKLMITTLIAKIDTKKKVHILNPNHQACYDHINGFFYVFIWA